MFSVSMSRWCVSCVTDPLWAPDADHRPVALAVDVVVSGGAIDKRRTGRTRNGERFDLQVTADTVCADTAMEREAVHNGPQPCCAPIHHPRDLATGRRSTEGRSRRRLELRPRRAPAWKTTGPRRWRERDLGDIGAIGIHRKDLVVIANLAMECDAIAVG
jgi:hypothetical protein